MRNHAIVTTKNAIWYILAISALLRAAVMITAGDSMYLYSDDVTYIYSAIDFLKSGHITYAYQDYITVFGMPGMFVFLAGIFKIFGYGETGIFAAKVIFNILGVLTVYGIYLTAKIISKNDNIANIAALMSGVSLPLICINNLFLTETPSLCLLIFLTYFLFKFAEEPREGNFVFLVLTYIACVLFKPVFGIYPAAFLPVFIYRHFSFKEIVKRGLMAAVALIVCVAPWSIKNYCVTGDVILLSGNQGDTLLLGSFDGEDVPPGTYNEAVQAADAAAQEKGLSHPYFRFKERGVIGKARMDEWKETAPMSYYKSTYFLKPWKLIKSVYYPFEIFGIKAEHIYPFHNIQLILSAVGIAICILLAKRNFGRFCYAASFLLGSLLIIYINSHYAAIARYGMTMLLATAVFAALGIYFIAKAFRLLLIKVGLLK